MRGGRGSNRSWKRKTFTKNPSKGLLSALIRTNQGTIQMGEISPTRKTQGLEWGFAYALISYAEGEECSSQEVDNGDTLFLRQSGHEVSLPEKVQCQCKVLLKEQFSLVWCGGSSHIKNIFIIYLGPSWHGQYRIVGLRVESRGWFQIRLCNQLYDSNKRPFTVLSLSSLTSQHQITHRWLLFLETHFSLGSPDSSLC